MTSADTFQDLDLSAVVGARSAMVYLEVATNFQSLSRYYITKPKGFGGASLTHRTGGASTIAPGTNVETASGFGYVWVMTDSSGVIQHSFVSNAITVTVKVLGFLPQV